MLLYPKWLPGSHASRAPIVQTGDRVREVAIDRGGDQHHAYFERVAGRWPRLDDTYAPL